VVPACMPVCQHTTTRRVQKVCMDVVLEHLQKSASTLQNVARATNLRFSTAYQQAHA
jgi:hypothetical protein